MPWKVLYRQRSVLIIGPRTKFRINTQQLTDFFNCNDAIVNFYANYIPFCIKQPSVTVRSVIQENCRKLCIRIENDLVYVPIRVGFKLLHLQKLLQNNVLLFINMQLGINKSSLVL